MTELTPESTPSVSLRLALLIASHRIAVNYNKSPAGPVKAVSKLFVAPRWVGIGQRAPGLRRWKRGELFELSVAALRRDWVEAREELGDVGYYAAQSWDWIWKVYTALVPASVVEEAAKKFRCRAERLVS